MLLTKKPPLKLNKVKKVYNSINNLNLINKLILKGTIINYLLFLLILPKDLLNYYLKLKIL